MTPEELQSAVQSAANALQSGQTDEAVRQAKAILTVFPGEPNASQIIALVLLQKNLADEALPHLRNAERAAPSHPPILNLLGVAFKQQGKREDAHAMFTRSTQLAPDFIDAWLNLGQMDLDAGDLNEARHGFDEALKLQPFNAKGLTGAARAALISHENEIAADMATKALAINPGNISVRKTLVIAKLRLEDFDAAKAEAHTVTTADDATPIDRAMAFGFAGDADEQLGNYEEAFASYMEANRIQTEIHKDFANPPLSHFHPEVIKKMMEKVKGNAIGAAPPCPRAERMPVFLVGFPRSGTTLLEQLLLAHPKISGPGENATFSKVVEDLVLDDEGRDRLVRLTTQEAVGYRHAYWEKVAALGAIPEQDEIYLDKLPLNTTLLPVIGQVFPRAKILFVIRDPRDVVMSCYQRRFGMNHAMYRFLDLQGAATFYDQVMGLGMAARDARSFDLFEVRYEDLIADLEGVARRIVGFLDLEWTASVLDYRKGAKARAINTPSAAQVVQPIYTTAQGKWRNYESHLEPVRPLLDPWAERFLYKVD